MAFVYYSAVEETIYFLMGKADDHGTLIGTVSQLPRRPAFVVQSLLNNAGYVDITGLTFVRGERQPLMQEATPHE